METTIEKTKPPVITFCPPYIVFNGIKCIYCGGGVMEGIWTAEQVEAMPDDIFKQSLLCHPLEQKDLDDIDRQNSEFMETEKYEHWEGQLCSLYRQHLEYTEKFCEYLPKEHRDIYYFFSDHLFSFEECYEANFAMFQEDNDDEYEQDDWLYYDHIGNSPLDAIS